MNGIHGERDVCTKNVLCRVCRIILCRCLPCAVQYAVQTRASELHIVMSQIAGAFSVITFLELDHIA